MDMLAGLLQQQLQHSDSVFHARDLHEKELLHQQRLHEAEMRYELGRFRKSELLSLDLQEAKLKMAVGLAERDAVRDALSHRSQIAQSIMMVNTVVMGCDFMFIYQLNIAYGTADSIMLPYVTALGLSVILVLLSIATALALQRRVLRYELHKPLKRYSPCGRSHSNFSSYFDCHCRAVEQWSLWFFNAGTASLMITTMLLFHAQMTVTYQLPAIGAISMVLLGLAALLLLLGDVALPTATHHAAVDIVGGPSYDDLLRQFPQKRREVKRQGFAALRKGE